MRGNARHCPVGTWYSRPCHGQAMISPSSAHCGRKSASAISVPVVRLAAHSGPPWCAQRLSRPYSRPPMLNTPISRPSTETTRCVPSGKSATRPTTVTIDPEQRERVLPEHLAPQVVAQRHLVELDRVVEVVVRPVRGVHRRVLAVVELDQGDDVAQPLGLLDRLRGHVDALDVVTRALGQERHLAAALDVLL